MPFRPIVAPQVDIWDYRIPAEDFNAIVSGHRIPMEGTKCHVLLVSKPDYRGEGVFILFDVDEGGEQVRAEYKSLHRGDKFDGVVLHKIWWESVGGGIVVADVDDARTSLLAITNILVGTKLPGPDGKVETFGME